MLLTVKQAAKRLQVSRQMVYQLCAAKVLPHSRVGLGRGSIRVSEADLDAYLATRHVDFEEPKLRHIS
jgi:excisionase family DNA binding protein